jgi:hypothetical protein
MCGQVCLLISGGYLIESDIILAVSFGQFEAAERKSAHMSWDMPYANVSYATYREILSYEASRRSGIRNTEITNVRIECALLLVNCATECVPAVTSMG